MGNTSPLFFLFICTIRISITINHINVINANTIDPLCPNNHNSSYCPNNYPCRIGSKNYLSMNIFSKETVSTLPWFETTTIRNNNEIIGDYYCDCEEYNAQPDGRSFGMTGIDCGVMFQRCPDDDDRETTVCFHGSTCVPRSSNATRDNDGIGSGRSAGHSCDCKAKSMYPTDTFFVGMSCEYEVTTFCPSVAGYSPNDFFCVNGGTCPTNPWEKCICPEPYAGPNCEFHTLQPNQPKCTLPCENKGTCFFGPEPIQTPYGLHLNHPNTTTTTTTFSNNNSNEDQTNDMKQHCKCPDGYTGLFCQIPVTVCGNSKNDHYCLSNGECVITNDNGDGEDGNDGSEGSNNGGDYSCDCTQNENVRYEGEYCQYKTTFCDGDGGVGGRFCMHNGRCMPRNRNPTKSASSHQCICPHGFTGRSCEIVSGGKESEATIIARDIMWMYLVILALGSFAVLTLIFIRYRRKSFLYDDVDEDEEKYDEEAEEEEGVCGVIVDIDGRTERVEKDELHYFYGGYFT